MGVADLPLLDVLKSSMSFLNARTKVLSENVANADTPKYKARDLDRPDFGKMLEDGRAASRKGAMRTSDARHMSGASNKMDDYKFQETPDTEGSVNGNQVSLESQMMKVAETQMEYQTAASIYKKSLGMLRLAASGGNQG